MAKLIKQSKRTFHPRRWLIGLGLVVLVAAGGGAGWYYIHTKDASKKDTASKQAESDKPYTIQDELKAAKDKLTKAKTKDEKLKAYHDLSNLYANTDDTSAAIESAKKMVELDASAATYSQLGFASAMNKDYKAAVEAYKKAAELSNPKVDDGRTDYSYYLNEAKIYEGMEE